MTCEEKKQYPTAAAAEADRRKLEEVAKRTGRQGKSYKRLNVYRCPTCNHFHVGRANQPRRRADVNIPLTKVPTLGELRRKAARMKREWEDHDDRLVRRRVVEIGKIVARDLAELERDAELDAINRFRVADLLDSIRQAEHIAETIKPR